MLDRDIDDLRAAAERDALTGRHLAVVSTPGKREVLRRHVLSIADDVNTLS